MITDTGGTERPRDRGMTSEKHIIDLDDPQLHKDLEAVFGRNEDLPEDIQSFCLRGILHAALLSDRSCLHLVTDENYTTFTVRGFGPLPEHLAVNLSPGEKCKCEQVGYPPCRGRHGAYVDEAGTSWGWVDFAPLPSPWVCTLLHALRSWACIKGRSTQGRLLLRFRNQLIAAVVVHRSPYEYCILFPDNAEQEGSERCQGE